jgi:hypothetical protein
MSERPARGLALLDRWSTLRAYVFSVSQQQQKFSITTIIIITIVIIDTRSTSTPPSAQHISISLALWST